jgi:adenosine deaminase
VFGCSLSSEFERAAAILNLSGKEIFGVSRRALKFVFAGGAEKAALDNIWAEFEKKFFGGLD